ncbi:MAG TPA: class I SAM-dependent methyltransferase [candidate division Zixibacteria bacterium]|nr:class I SAM-dependent methyltransferase [candidate division Zixibacteria bacterium]
MTPKDKFSADEYWDNRYKSSDRGSGEGSRGNLKDQKIEIINDLIKKHGIESVFDYGCGDGIQVEELLPIKYVGADISETSVEMCRSKYAEDPNKSFFVTGNYPFDTKFDMSMSLDVLYHIPTEAQLEEYIRNLFKVSSNIVVIYTTNYKKRLTAKHVFKREFFPMAFKWIEGFTLIETIYNPVKKLPNFYIFQKTEKITKMKKIEPHKQTVRKARETNRLS